MLHNLPKFLAVSWYKSEPWLGTWEENNVGYGIFDAVKAVVARSFQSRVLEYLWCQTGVSLGKNVSSMSYETMIKVFQTKKLTEFAQSSRLREIADHLYILGWMNLPVIDGMFEEIKAVYSKVTFLCICNDATSV